MKEAFSDLFAVIVSIAWIMLPFTLQLELCDISRDIRKIREILERKEKL